MTVERRIYVCEDTTVGINSDHKWRLIKAANPAQVRNHASRTRFKVTVATQDDLVDLAVSKGIKVEEAAAAEPEPKTE